MKLVKLECGGTAIFTIDPKTKQEIQTGYIGASLPVDAWINKDEKK